MLFLDEPTTGLDPVSRIAIWDEVRRLNDEGTTVFLTTQYLEEADQLADRVGIIDEGKMAAEGTPAVLKAQIGRSHLEVVIAEGGSDAAEVILARFGDPMPSKNGVLMVGLRARRLGHRADRARAGRRGAMRRVARPRAADARRRVRREDGSPPRGRRRGGAAPSDGPADEPVSA